MAEMGKVQGDRVVLGLAEGERRPCAVVVAADQNVVGAGERRATDQGIDAVQITAARGTTPIVEGLVEAGFGANERRLIGRAPRGGIGYVLLVHQHGPVPALTLSLELSSDGFSDDEFKTGRRRFVRTNLEHQTGRIKLMKG
jgi:hypothetical protein